MQTDKPATKQKGIRHFLYKLIADNLQSLEWRIDDLQEAIHVEKFLQPATILNSVFGRSLTAEIRLLKR